MRENIEKELIRSIAKEVPEREFIYYIMSVLTGDVERKRLIQYLKENSGSSKQEITIKAMDIKQKR